MSDTESQVSNDEASLKVDFFVIDGPFKHKEKQWPIENPNTDGVKDWTTFSLPGYFPGSQIHKFDFFADPSKREQPVIEETKKEETEPPEQTPIVEAAQAEGETANEGESSQQVNGAGELNESETAPAAIVGDETAEEADESTTEGPKDAGTEDQAAGAADAAQEQTGEDAKNDEEVEGIVEPEAPEEEEEEYPDFWTSKGFTQLARNLLDFIKEKGYAENDRDIAFISTGLGGALVKKAMILACYDPQYAFIPASTRTLVFYGVPHRLVTPETWEDIVSRMLWDAHQDDQTKPWRISGLAAALREIQAEYLLISEAWGTVNVYAEPDEGTPVLSEQNNSFGGYNGLRYSRYKPYSDITKYGDNDDFHDMMESVKERAAGSYSDAQQSLTRLAPPLPLPMAIKVEAAHLSEKITSDIKFSTFDDMDKSGALLFVGEHGSGKTFLFRTIFYHFRDQERDYTSLFTFDCNDARRDSEAEFLMSMIRQNLLIAPEKFPDVEDVYDRTVGSGRTSKEDLLLLFRALIRALKDNYLIMCINAIDECEDLAPFLALIRTLMATAGPRLKLVMTTTPKKQVLETLHDVPTISIDTKVSDIPEYVDFINRRITSLIEERPFLEEFRPDILARIALCDNFLQATLLLNQLRSAPLWSSPRSIRKGIEKILFDLNAIIDKTLGDDIPHWAADALSWMTYAVRPLNQNELAVAVALEDGFANLKDLDEILSRDIVGDLQQIFGTLVKVQDGEVRLVHQLAYETIIEKYADHPIHKSDSSETDQWRITRLCLEYLSSEDVKELARSPQPRGLWVSRQKGIFALSRYVAKYWPLHYQRLAQSEKHSEYILAKLKDTEFVQTWVALIPDEVRPDDSDQHPTPTKPVHFAAELGLADVLELLLVSYTEDDIGPHDLALALELASKNGHSDVVEQLLDHGIEDPSAIMKALDEPSRNGIDSVVQALVQSLAEQKPSELEFPSSLLGRASRNGHAPVVEILLRAGAPVNELYEGSTPLHLAVAEGHDEVVKALLAGEADTSIEDGNGLTPLLIAASNADSSIVEQLLNARANTDPRDSEGFTALHLAAKKADTASVRLLLAAKAEATPLSNTNVTALHIAAQYGHLDIVEALLADGADINHEDDSFYTPLLHSCESGHQEVSKLLIEKGATPDGSATSEYTPLYYAISSQEEVATLLIEKGADPNKVSNGNRPLTEAARRGSLELVQLLLSKGAKTADDQERTSAPIHAAASSGSNEIVKLLIEQEANVNQADESGKTALHFGITNGYTEVVKTLLENGAVPTKPDDSQATPLHYGARYGHTEAMTLLIEKGASISALDEDKRSPLHHAADFGNLDAAKFLVEKGAPLDEDDKWNNTPLILAINVSSEGIARFLVEKGADTRHKNSDGDTPLHRAAWNGSQPIMDLLTKEGEVNIDIRSENEETPLFRAFFYTEAARWICDHNANVNVQSKDGTTPLMFMAKKGDVATFKLLIERQADIHKLDENQNSALHLAASSGEIETVKILLENGINVNQRNDDKQTPLIAASRDGYTKIVEALLDKGADIDVEDYHLNTPLQMAAYYGRVETTKLLIERKAKLEIADADGDTELLNSVKGDDLECTRLLLAAGADPEAYNKEGNNSLLCALNNRNSATQMIKLLLEFKADPDKARAQNKASAVHIAAVSGDLETLQLFIDAKADLNLQDEQGRTPVHWAAQKNRVDSVIALIEAGCNREAVDYQGRNLIHFAVPHYSLSDLSNLVSRVLKIRGTRPRQLNAPDLDGWSPLHWACKQGESGVIRLLRAANANPVKRDKKGWTPRQIAIHHNKRDLLAYLKPDDSEKKAKARATAAAAAGPSNADGATSPTVATSSSELGPGSLARANTGLLDDDASTDGGQSEADFKTGQEHYAYCDSCYVSIYGIRFKCQDCPDFDFCFKCMWRAKQIHDPKHTFKRIGNGPDQGPYSLKEDEDEEMRRAEEAANSEGAVVGEQSVTPAAPAAPAAVTESGDANTTAPAVAPPAVIETPPTPAATEEVPEPEPAANTAE